MARPQRTGSDFGVRLAALRRSRSLTQVQLAETIGTSQRVLSYYENHADYPPAQVVAALARALEVSSDELLGLRASPIAAADRVVPPAPTGKMRRVVDEVARLPRRQQEKIADVVSALVSQYEQSRQP